jgi:hypothetical protein
MAFAANLDFSNSKNYPGMFMIVLSLVMVVLSSVSLGAARSEYAKQEKVNEENAKKNKELANVKNSSGVLVALSVIFFVGVLVWFFGVSHTTKCSWYSCVSEIAEK